MSELYIRPPKSPDGTFEGRWITFCHTPQDLADVQDNYIEGRRILIGDINTFTKEMRSMLLKLIEEHPSIDCLSGCDPNDSTLQSRFSHIYKYPLEWNPKPSHDADAFRKSARDYIATGFYLPSSPSAIKLRAPLLRGKFLNFLLQE